MIDEAVRTVFARLEAQDGREREEGVARERRSRAIPATTGRFLMALVAPHAGCRVLEIGGSRGYSSIWLAAGVRLHDGRVLSLEHDPVKCRDWRRNIADAGLAGTAGLVEGDAFVTLASLTGGFDLVFLDAEKEDYERLFALVRPRVEAGGLIVADNVLSHADPLADYSRARQDDPTLASVTVPLDRGLELSVVLSRCV